MLARVSPVDGRARLAADEEHHRRQREHAEPRRDGEVHVDVHAEEPHAAFLGDGPQVRLDRVARLAPRRPEVDEDGLRRGEHLVGERLVRDLVHYSRPVSARSRSSGTFQIASATIAPVIFEAPARRSTKRMGISCTRKPARSTRYVVSIWNA